MKQHEPWERKTLIYQLAEQRMSQPHVFAYKDFLDACAGVEEDLRKYKEGTAHLSDEDILEIMRDNERNAHKEAEVARSVVDQMLEGDEPQSRKRRRQ
ncbi:MAG: hypothetical protein WCW16_00455 [Candidatus Magasanikbacteria bacterium]